MGGFQLAPLDPLPQPETEKVQARPASLELTQPPAPSGNIGPGGQVANIAANFLQGWTMGTHITEQKKAQAMQQDINAAWLAYNIADQSGQRAMKDPSATDEQKKAIEHQRSQAWDHWVETHKKYATPEKGAKGGKGGGKKEGGGIGGFLSQIFMPQAPHAGGGT